jgi:4-methyl-5(b-hydroxyethyl)-thiazole monophosphate biosynthesis
MKKRVLCLLSDGVEEIEAVVPIDLLRRAGLDVVTASIGPKTVTGRCGIRIEADELLADHGEDRFALLLLPGGPGVALLRKDGRAAALAGRFAAAGKPVAAICAAPLVLKDAGLLEDAGFTCHSSVVPDLPGALDGRVVEDRGIITSRGAGTAQEFALRLVALLCGEETMRRVAAEIMA